MTEARAPFKFVYVASYGRSGSTLLQGILNSIDGALIRGENNGAFHALYRAYKLLSESIRGKRVKLALRDGVADSWYGIQEWDLDALRAGLSEVFIRTVLRPHSGTRLLGFKEIRHGLDEVPDLDSYFEFVRAAFPGVRFVFNSRDLDATAKSDWWQGNPGARAYLARTESRLRDWHARHGDDSFWVHYDDYTGRPEALKPLYEFLGEPWDRERIAAAMTVRYSYPRLSR